MKEQIAPANPGNAGNASHRAHNSSEAGNVLNRVAGQVTDPPGDSLPTSKSRFRRVVVLVVLASSVAGAVLGARWLEYRSKHVVVDDAEIKGTITKLGARLDGQVKAILAAPGERVEKGQVLVRLEDLHFQAALQLAEAEFEAATNEVHCEKLAIEEERRRLPMEVERSSNMFESASAVLEGARSEAVRLNNEFERYTVLSREGMASDSQLDLITGQRGKAQAEVKSAASLREAAQSSLEAAKLQLQALRVREARLGSLQAQVSVARAKVAAAQADLEATLLRAPEDGWVVERIVEVGGSAKVGEPMLSLWIGRAWVEAWASEKALGYMQLGSRAKVRLDAFPGRALEGRVTSFGLLTDKELLTHPVPTTLDSLVRKGALVRVCISLEADNLRLQPGLSAIVGIEKTSATTSGPTAVAGRTRAAAVFASTRIAGQTH
jgi:membrane fusion protein, multidrug efflux system